MNTPIFCALDQYALLLVKGPDAKKFLQGQVTCDIDTLTIDNHETASSLGAHCTHKGRILFTFRALALDELTIGLCIPRSMMEIATQALKKYIVFSKAELIDGSHLFQLIGLKAEEEHQLTDTLLSLSLNASSKNERASISEHGIALRVDEHRYELWLTNEQAEKCLPLLDKHKIFQADKHTWTLDNINAEIGEIYPSTSGLMTPHAINFQTTSTAISFNKGCYTGQEVVARMHYLGKLKRKMFIFELPSDLMTSSEELLIGAAVYTPNKEQSIGEIINIGHTQDGVYRLLVSVTVEHAENNQVFIDSDCQKKLHLIAL